MIIGEVAYLNFEDNNGYVKILSHNDFGEKIDFIPSEINFQIDLCKLICLTPIGMLGYEFTEFELARHRSFLDIEMIKEKSRIDICSNLNLVNFIIDNELDDNNTSDLKKLRVIKELINYNPSNPGNTVKDQNMKKLISEYTIRYSEYGKDKPGDRSKAWISIMTDRPSNLPDFSLDKYLDKLLPKFDFIIAQGEDCDDYKFKSDILRNLTSEIGSDNIEQIKIICGLMTENIRNFALLVYNEGEHARSLWYYYSELRSKIINEYLLKR
ncbi:hypothetical protein QLS91_04105 [Flavobacterium sp. LB2P84]|uniref:hypothetical protein n=1 Tax=Flavobacterium yafengii TaxID=3041253 RepID=UPI0024A9B4BE|nr:hypothetical protein [Flavobacterium yafengii]MDI6032249.1 hypothetical protein [Flavobacterium yafengii]